MRQIEHAKRVFFDANPYVYGGMWSPTELRHGTDLLRIVERHPRCSHHPGRQMGREAEGATMESYRYVGDPGSHGPFGTIRAASAVAVPADVPAKIALHHGPGGDNSDMWGEVDGARMESRGGKNTVTGRDARAFTDPYAKDLVLPTLPEHRRGHPIVDSPNAVTWGIDIPNHQGIVNLKQVKREGFDFIWVKVSEGFAYATRTGHPIATTPAKPGSSSPDITTCASATPAPEPACSWITWPKRRSRRCWTSRTAPAISTSYGPSKPRSRNSAYA